MRFDMAIVLQNFLKRSTLKFVLIIPFVFLIIILGTVIGYRSYKNSNDAVKELSRKVLSEMAGQGELAIVGYLNDTDLVLNAFAPDYHGGNKSKFDYESNEAIEQRFFELTTISDAVTYLYIGRPNGDYIGVDRGSKKGIQVKIKDSQYKERTTFIAKVPGDRSKFKSEDKGYNPLTRPWYIAATSSNKLSWAPLFVSWSRNVLMITRSKPVVDAEGKFHGVVTTDRPLDKLSEFLVELKKKYLTLRADAFIIEANGDLIASTSDPVPYIKGKEKDSFTRISAANSKSEIIRYTADYLRENQAILSSKSFESHSFEVTKDRVHMSLKKISGLQGLDWFVVVAAPESDFNGNIVAEMKRTISYTVLALLLCICIGYFILRWVTDDLEDLTKASEHFAMGEEIGTLPLHRNDEIGTLAVSFKNMMRQIEKQRYELKKYNEELELRVKERTKELAEKNLKLQEEIRVRKLAQEKILQLFNVVELTDEAILVCDTSKNVQYLNPAFMRITGYTLEDMKAENMRLLKSGRYDAKTYDMSIYESIIKKLNSGRTFRGVLNAIRKSGEVYKSEVTITPVFNDEGELSAYTAVERDVTSLEKERQEHIDRLSLDKLTGLMTREILLSKIEPTIFSPEETTRRAILKQGLAILYIDIDDMKFINKKYGFEVGDEVIKNVASSLLKCAFETDLIIRLEGDKFAVIVTSVTSLEAVQVAMKRIEELFQIAFRIDSHVVKVSISIGASIFPMDGKNFESLLIAADDRMYEMKKLHKKMVS